MGILRRTLLLLALSVGFTLGWALFWHKNQEFNALNWRIIEIEPSKVIALDSPLILDAREREAFENGHILNAINLSESTWDDDIINVLNEWRPECDVVVYCSGQACGASRRTVLRLLGDLPSIRIYILKGGYPAWVEYQSLIGISRL